MQIQGTVVTIENDVEISKNGGGSYKGSRLAYRDESGALKEQNFHNNALKFNPSIKSALSNLVVGSVFTMVKEKEGEFWNVKSIIVGTANAGSNNSPKSHTASGATQSPRSTYETPEERAQKQVYIVRQSSITAALTLLGSKAKTVEDVISMAKQFENYIFDNYASKDTSFLEEEEGII